MTEPPPFLAGVNYWPAATAMHWWSRFDLEAARADLTRLKAAGFDYVRFFLLWEAFQPEPDRVSSAALRDLVRFADAAAALGVALQPTLFTGHMSGANWLPPWATTPSLGRTTRFPTMVGGVPRPDRQPGPFYEDEHLAAAQARLARELGRVLAGHPALWSWDLGNEPSNVTRPRTRDHGRRWLARMVGALRDGGSEHPITIGLHMEDLEADRQLGPAEAAEVCDYLAMHGYPLYAAWARQPLDAVVLPFLGLVTRWLGRTGPVLFQEFGLPVRPPDYPLRGQNGHSVLFDDIQGAAFYQAALAELRREEDSFLGAFAWCANDYARTLWDSPPLGESEHERFFGLFRADGSAKPTLNPWIDLRHSTLAASPDPPRGVGWIDTTPERFWQAPHGELRRLYARFIAL